MHLRYNGHAANIDDQCAMLEAVADGLVRSCILEIDSDPAMFEGKCCVKCAELQLHPCAGMPGELTSDPSRGPQGRNAPLTRKQAMGMQLALASGDASAPAARAAIQGTLRAHGARNPAPGLEIAATARKAAMSIQSAHGLVRTRNGNPLELAIFQCAQERRRSRDCWIIVDYDADAMHPYLEYSDGSIKDPCVSARKPDQASCGCGAHG